MAWTDFTDTVGGVEWRCALHATTSNGACVGRDYGNKGSGSVPDADARATANTTDITGALEIPETLTVDGVEYKTAYVANRAFRDYTGITSVTFPSQMFHVMNAAFYGCTGIKGIWFKGPSSGSLSLRTYATPTANNAPFAGCSTVKYALFGPNTTMDSSKPINFPSADGCTFFVPYGASSYTTYASSKLNGTDPVYVYYGSGADLDIEGADGSDGGTLTFVPANETGLQTALAHAAALGEALNTTVKIKITDSYNGSVALTSDMLDAVAFETNPWAWTTISVTTQSDLDKVLAAFAASTPIVLDITGSTESITIPSGRKIAVWSDGETTYGLRKKGLFIIVR